MQKKEFLKKLILGNYMTMLERKDKKAIRDFMNNPKAMSSFLCALGASEETMNMPAHRETLEDCLKSIISSTLSAIQDGETGYEVEYLENGIKTHTESLKYEERYCLQFYKDMYTFDVSRNIGEVSKRVMANLREKFIVSKTEKSLVGTLGEMSTKRKYLNLDTDGFVIGEAIQEGDKIKRVHREGMKNFRDNDKQGIAWNGNPSALNEKSASAKEFQKNMCNVIAKYPQTEAYYESMVGKDIVDKVVKLLETRESNV